MSKKVASTKNKEVRTQKVEEDADMKRKVQSELMNFLMKIAQEPKEEQEQTKMTKTEDQVTSTKDIFQKDFVVEKRFRVIEKMKGGHYSQMYQAQDTTFKKEVLIKAETSIPVADNAEIDVLKQFQGKAGCPKLYATGGFDVHSYVVIQIHGESLSELRHSCSMKPSRLSISAVYRCTLQMLRTIELLHQIGFVHRDIKPSNFAIGKEIEDRKLIYLVDYGLCRSHLNKDGSVKTPRVNAGYRGTVRYASLNAHANKELSRRDDLWSWFYTFVELISGQLPWRKTNDKNIVGQLKNTFSPEVLSQSFSNEIREIVNHVQKLKYEDKPDYALIKASLNKGMQTLNIKSEDPYDWLMKDCRTLIHFNLPEYGFH